MKFDFLMLTRRSSNSLFYNNHIDNLGNIGSHEFLLAQPRVSATLCHVVPRCATGAG